MVSSATTTADRSQQPPCCPVRPLGDHRRFDRESKIARPVRLAVVSLRISNWGLTMVKASVRRLFSLVAVAAVAAGSVVVSSVPVTAQPGGFGDAAEGAFYSVPVSTLAEQGLFAGTGCDEGFCPDDPLDRKTMAVWVVRVLDGEDSTRSHPDEVQRRGRGRLLCAVRRAHGRSRSHLRLRRWFGLLPRRDGDALADGGVSCRGPTTCRKDRTRVSPMFQRTSGMHQR